MPATTKSFIWPCGQRSQNSFLYMKLSRILINIHVHTKYDKMCLQRDNTWKPEYPRDTYNLSRRVLTSSLVFGTHYFSQTITKVALVGLMTFLLGHVKIPFYKDTTPSTSYEGTKITNFLQKHVRTILTIQCITIPLHMWFLRKCFWIFSKTECIIIGPNSHVEINHLT